MSDIVVTEFMDEAALEPLTKHYRVVFDPTLVDNPERLNNVVGNARAIIVRNRTQVRGPLLAQAHHLVCVGRLGVGLDNIDLEACKARGIAVYPATGANDLSVAEYVLTTALLLLRRAYFANDAMVAGMWPRTALMGNELAGKTVGLVGFGSVARRTAALFGALSTRVVASDPMIDPGDAVWGSVKPMKLEALLATSDVISLHVPLNEQTRGMIGADALASMKPGAILINAARGGIVDEPAIVHALKEGRLSGAALDVFESEPLDAVAGARFADVPNLILTPHIAGVTIEGNVRVSHVTVENVLRHLKEVS
ncbi:MAG: hydroxyacid dehydrogenase [Pseudomonadota bacterium]